MKNLLFQLISGHHSDICNEIGQIADQYHERAVAAARHALDQTQAARGVVADELSTTRAFGPEAPDRVRPQQTQAAQAVGDFAKDQQIFDKAVENAVTIQQGLKDAAATLHHTCGMKTHVLRLQLSWMIVVNRVFGEDPAGRIDGSVMHGVCKAVINHRLLQTGSIDKSDCGTDRITSEALGDSDTLSQVVLRVLNLLASAQELASRVDAARGNPSQQRERQGLISTLSNASSWASWGSYIYASFKEMLGVQLTNQSFGLLRGMLPYGRITLLKDQLLRLEGDVQSFKDQKTQDFQQLSSDQPQATLGQYVEGFLGALSSADLHLNRVLGEALIESVGDQSLHNSLKAQGALLGACVAVCKDLFDQNGLKCMMEQCVTAGYTSATRTVQPLLTSVLLFMFDTLALTRINLDLPSMICDRLKEVGNVEVQNILLDVLNQLAKTYRQEQLGHAARTPGRSLDLLELSQTEVGQDDALFNSTEGIKVAGRLLSILVHGVGANSLAVHVDTLKGFDTSLGYVGRCQVSRASFASGFQNYCNTLINRAGHEAYVQSKPNTGVFCSEGMQAVIKAIYKIQHTPKGQWSSDPEARFPVIQKNSVLLAEMLALVEEQVYAELKQENEKYTEKMSEFDVKLKNWKVRAIHYWTMTQGLSAEEQAAIKNSIVDQCGDTALQYCQMPLESARSMFAEDLEEEGISSVFDDEAEVGVQDASSQVTQFKQQAENLASKLRSVYQQQLQRSMQQNLLCTQALSEELTPEPEPEPEPEPGLVSAATPAFRANTIDVPKTRIEAMAKAFHCGQPVRLEFIEGFPNIKLVAPSSFNPDDMPFQRDQIRELFDQQYEACFDPHNTSGLETDQETASDYALVVYMAAVIRSARIREEAAVSIQGEGVAAGVVDAEVPDAVGVPQPEVLSSILKIIQRRPELQAHLKGLKRQYEIGQRWRLDSVDQTITRLTQDIASAALEQTVKAQFDVVQQAQLLDTGINRRESVEVSAQVDPLAEAHKKEQAAQQRFKDAAQAAKAAKQKQQLEQQLRLLDQARQDAAQETLLYQQKTEEQEKTEEALRQKFEHQRKQIHRVYNVIFLGVLIAASWGVSAVLLNPSLLIITPSITVSPLLCLNALIVFSVLYGLSAGQGMAGKAKALFTVALIAGMVLSPLDVGASFWMPWVTLHCSLLTLTVGLSCIGGLAMGLGYACSRISQKPAPREQLAGDILPTRSSLDFLPGEASPSAAVSSSCSTTRCLPQKGLQTAESRCVLVGS